MLSTSDLFSSSLIWRFQSFFGVEKVQCLERGKQKKWKTINIDEKPKNEDTPTEENIIYYRVRDCHYWSCLHLLPLQVNSWWYYFFLAGTHLGEEPFGAAFFSFWFWNLDSSIGRRLVLVWNLVMYLGQGLKDVIQLERPRMPEVVRLQTKWSEEFGLPSTHAMMGLSVPWAAFYLTLEKYSFPPSLAVSVTCVWVLLVTGSRMYLGMHSLADILAGLLLTTLLMPTLLHLVTISDIFLLSSPLAPFLSLSASLLALLLFPRTPNHHWSPSARTAVDVLACYQGVQLGQWCLFRLGLVQIIHHTSLTIPITRPDLSSILLIISRVLTGGAVAVAVQSIVKPATRYLSRFATISRTRQNLIIASKV